MPQSSSASLRKKASSASGTGDYGAVAGANGKHRERRVDSPATDEVQPLLPPEIPSDQTGLKQAQATLVPFGLGTLYNKIARLFRRTVDEVQGDEPVIFFHRCLTRIADPCSLDSRNLARMPVAGKALSNRKLAERKALQEIPVAGKDDH